jgi:hypothetical protein
MSVPALFSSPSIGYLCRQCKSYSSDELVNELHALLEHGTLSLSLCTHTHTQKSSSSGELDALLEHWNRALVSAASDDEVLMAADALYVIT